MPFTASFRVEELAPQNVAKRSSETQGHGAGGMGRDAEPARRFGARALRLVLEWASLHESELRANWELARRGEPLLRIAPLE